MLNEIKKYIEEKGNATLKEIYTAFPNKNRDSIRAIINISTKKGMLLRIEKGKYALKLKEIKDS